MHSSLATRHGRDGGGGGGDVGGDGTVMGRRKIGRRRDKPQTQRRVARRKLASGSSTCTLRWRVHVAWCANGWWPVVAGGRPGGWWAGWGC